MTALVNRHTNAPVRFVAGLSLMIRASEDVYGNLEGRRLEALARLFAQNVRIYVYPMTATNLQEWLKSVSITGWDWSQTNGWVSASQLRCAPPLGHLFAYLLASNFLVPMRVPADSGQPNISGIRTLTTCTIATQEHSIGPFFQRDNEAQGGGDHPDVRAEAGFCIQGTGDYIFARNLAQFMGLRVTEHPIASICRLHWCF